MPWPKKKPLVIVEWNDSASLRGWTDETKAIEHKPSIIRTVGWVIHRGKKHILVACSEDNNQSLADNTAIPRGCIRKIIIIKEPEEARRPKEK